MLCPLIAARHHLFLSNKHPPNFTLYYTILYCILYIVARHHLFLSNKHQPHTHFTTLGTQGAEKVNKLLLFDITSSFVAHTPFPGPK